MLDCAFIFPGQASQYVGMGRDLCERYPSARELFAQADASLGFPLSQVCSGGPEERLRQTATTQPAVFVHSLAVWQLMAAAGVRPVAVAGHSLGEYTALVSVGALPLAETLALVQTRGRLMQQVGEERPGAMAAVIGLDDSLVEALCRQAQVDLRDEVVVAANFNSPGQVVVSGTAAGVARAAEHCRQAGARKVAMLPVSGAFHSPLMQSAAEQLEPLLQQAPWQRPTAPVITNAGAVAVTDPADLQLHLMRQMTSPVRWTESVRALRSAGVQAVIELGPGSVLKGLVRRIEPDLEVRCAGTPEEIEAVLQWLSAT